VLIRNQQPAASFRALRLKSRADVVTSVIAGASQQGGIAPLAGTALVPG
jgi:hypothetical protein